MYNLLNSFICESDTYCPEADLFESVEAFEQMCKNCFGELPKLTLRGSDYYDESGRLVLREVSAQ